MVITTPRLDARDVREGGGNAASILRQQNVTFAFASTPTSSSGFVARARLSIPHERVVALTWTRIAIVSVQANPSLNRRPPARKDERCDVILGPAKHRRDCAENVEQMESGR